MSNIIERAKAYALQHHGDQKYGDEFPYSVHLQAVVSVLYRFEIANETRVSIAWLHDVLEDTNATYEDLITFFGVEIADAVAALTEPKGGNRAWRHSQSYPRIRQNANALIVKLPDRIANVESGGKKVGMYRKEHAEFKQALLPNLMLANTTILQPMWDHLDSLLVAQPVQVAPKDNEDTHDKISCECYGCVIWRIENEFDSGHDRELFSQYFYNKK